MANDQTALTQEADLQEPRLSIKQKCIKWVKSRFSIAITVPDRMNQAVSLTFFAGLLIEMFLTIPGIPTGYGVWFDYLVFGLGYFLAALIVYCILLFLFSFFYLRRIAGWLSGGLAVALQTYTILQKSNWGFKAAGLMTGIILAILIILAFFVSYLYAIKSKSILSVLGTLAALTVLITSGLAAKSYWNSVQKQTYLAQYSELLLQGGDKDSAADDTAKEDKKGSSDDTDTSANQDVVQDLPDDDAHKLSDSDKNQSRSYSLQALPQNMAEHGGYEFNHYVYGPNENWRDDHNEETIYLTPTDGSTLLKDWSWTKEQFWGFTEHDIPIKGQLWVPEGQGPFPIVFIMHGNHISEEDSSDGYHYLGELLASHGMIVSSIDANFLNYSVWSGIVDDDQLLRSWLMLAHIDKLNAEGNLQADWNNVALIGHSRGGQAASMAVDARKWIANEPVVSILEKINIKAVIAIAPTDYTVDSKLPYLKNVNYLTIHGTMDSDLTESFGERQYERTTFTKSGHFKATVEIYHANHGQFNTVWGKYDEQFPGALALNTADLMSGEDQRLAAKLFINSFLYASFTGDEKYEAVFQDFRIIGEYLPLTGYVSRYNSSDTKLWYDFERPQQAEEQIRRSEGMQAKTIDLKGRSGGDKKNRVLAVSWQQPESELTFPIQPRHPSNQEIAIGAIVVSIARAESLNLEEDENEESSSQNSDEGIESDLNEVVHQSDNNANPFNQSRKNNDHKAKRKVTNEATSPKAADTDEAYTGLQLILKLKAKQWGTESIDLEPYFHILQPAAHDFTKLDWLEQNIKKGKYDVSVEPLLQTYVIPVKLIEQQNPRDGALFVSDLEAISFIFKQEQGSVIIDALGFITEGGTYVEYRR